MNNWRARLLVKDTMLVKTDIFVTPDRISIKLRLRRTLVQPVIFSAMTTTFTRSFQGSNNSNQSIKTTLPDL